MRLLLDTHVVLWAISQDRRLTSQAEDLLDASEHVLIVSAVSILEIAIKNALPKPRSNIDITANRVLELLTGSGIEMLPASPRHAAAVEELPPIHNDPFDRLLVAQALTEPLILVTHDRIVASYSNNFILI